MQIRILKLYQSNVDGLDAPIFIICIVLRTIGYFQYDCIDNYRRYFDSTLILRYIKLDITRRKIAADVADQIQYIRQ